MSEPVERINLPGQVLTRIKAHEYIKYDLERFAEGVYRCTECHNEIPPGKAGRKCKQCRNQP